MAGAIEEPAYELVDKLDTIEIRQYEASIQAVTRLSSSRATSSGFRRLAGYIFGGNQDNSSIAMTAPVQETLEVREPIMAFTLPAEYQLEELPVPNDKSVDIVEIPVRTMAVISFSGWATGPRVDKYLAQLEQQLHDSAIEATGYPMLNQYNPPWTLPFLRRNEVMIEVILP